MNYDPSEQRLDINVPQAWVMKNYQNYVDPSLWENGINAATLSYNINAYRSENSNYTNDSVYTSFNGGVNLGAWRLRSSGNYSWRNDAGSNVEFMNRYVQRDITAIRSQLIMGNPTPQVKRSTPLVSVAFAYTATAECCRLYWQTSPRQFVV